MLNKEWGGECLRIATPDRWQFAFGNRSITPSKCNSDIKVSVFKIYNSIKYQISIKINIELTKYDSHTKSLNFRKARRTMEYPDRTGKKRLFIYLSVRTPYGECASYAKWQQNSFIVAVYLCTYTIDMTHFTCLILHGMLRYFHLFRRLFSFFVCLSRAFVLRNW